LETKNHFGDKKLYFECELLGVYPWRMKTSGKMCVLHGMLNLWHYVSSIELIIIRLEERERPQCLKPNTIHKIQLSDQAAYIIYTQNKPQETTVVASRLLGIYVFIKNW
jgi:hypothetical protein